MAEFKKLRELLNCNEPRKSPKEGKKKVVKACEDGEENIIHYGDSDYEHNYSKEAKENFRARHKCDEADDKLSARYWACKDLWGKTKKVGTK